MDSSLHRSTNSKHEINIQNLHPAIAAIPCVRGFLFRSSGRERNFCEEIVEKMEALEQWRGLQRPGGEWRVRYLHGHFRERINLYHYRWTTTGLETFRQIHTEESTVARWIFAAAR